MSVPLPPLHGRWLRTTRAPGRLLHGVPWLEDGVLARRGATRTVRVPVATASVSFRPLRPARLDLRVSGTAGTVEVELLRVGTGWGRTRSADELDACLTADVVAAGMLRRQAAHVRSPAIPETSPLARLVGPAQTRVGAVIGWMP